ncbi:uncharacterized protein MONOS_8565 [Monocercomonoides exilis]|uniref:uncharacterized protein n=1 Tax=Monocercomonoides exilis TaxID=2049356 RepID=UPI00355997B1|nr:hypothetical protein MONOS_8565 [Monocercomonoides exilis]|eukprot:MONOS_8565.1-p1 / transcript=MONOS_8565.1 / gene=MONOS_8565 / organism=Monocercomonoides_exilis_PA203 / gene_product=unspecified product / transcript_product=unspecified product / location=Mono_scaffold00326:38297-38851(-) / protein_length=185 / sequence_SO=supercontig / SO=protein_coding / is_pseudo=false
MPRKTSLAGAASQHSVQNSLSVSSDPFGNPADRSESSSNASSSAVTSSASASGSGSSSSSSSSTLRPSPSHQSSSFIPSFALPHNQFQTATVVSYSSAALSNAPFSCTFHSPPPFRSSHSRSPQLYPSHLPLSSDIHPFSPTPRLSQPPHLQLLPPIHSHFSSSSHSASSSASSSIFCFFPFTS